MRLCFRVWFLCCPYLSLISPSFGASGRQCFVILAFPEYLHLYFWFVCFFPLGVIGRLCSIIVAIPGHLLSILPKLNCSIYQASNYKVNGTPDSNYFKVYFFLYWKRAFTGLSGLAGKYIDAVHQPGTFFVTGFVFK